ncbi:gamma carbonic anhydrase family protein [uncultured Mitsuokella sp.]|jgi:carbonic anhydrase/acetyltransferase-like protein (isoleucine patch superfamily)|uniref:gamma carbonic anhydrase family protein n=1 Tax=uncultured Mitsuokella sp. TaxID=453120 RepID=UPI0025DAE719|nr:gamma carbonic anhydrase family protein [uncultured Mitsuokella sp.]
MALIMPYESAAPKIDQSVFLAPNATVVGDVTIGEGASVWFGAVIRGDFQPVVIGKNTNIQDNATIHVMYEHPTTIGEGVIIGHNVIIHAKSIGDHSLIGMGSIIMGNTIIGENVIIGAGSIIERDRKIPPNSIVYGRPAQIIRGLRDDEIEALKESALSYREVAAKYKAELL